MQEEINKIETFSLFYAYYDPIEKEASIKTAEKNSNVQNMHVTPDKFGQLSLFG